MNPILPNSGEGGEGTGGIYEQTFEIDCHQPNEIKFSLLCALLLVTETGIGVSCERTCGDGMFFTSNMIIVPFTL